MVRVPTYQGPGLQPTPVVQFESPTIRPMEDVVSPQIQQMGQSMAQLGQGMQEVGVAQMRQAQRDQDELDRADAIRAFVDYKGRVSERLNNDETGYFRTQGEQAYGANKTAVLEELAKYREEIGRTLTSPGARQLFGQRADADDLQTFTAMDSHAGDQRNKYIQSQEKALIDSEIEDLQKFHGNPEFGNRMQALMDNIRDSRAMRGLDPKVVEQAQKEVKATVYSGAIDDIAGKDPVKALEALNQFAGTGALPPKYVTDKRAELQRKVDEVVGDLHGYRAWDASNGNPSVAKIDLDRQRREGKLTPSQYRQSLSAVALQEASQREQRAAYEQDTYDEAIRRLADPKVTLDNFSQAEKDKLIQANRWDDVVLFVSQGRQRYDNPAEVRRAEDYLVRVQNGEAEPMSELQFRRMFFTNMSDGTYNDLSSINRGYLSAVAKASGGGRQGDSFDKQEEELINLDLQTMLASEGVANFKKIETGLRVGLTTTAETPETQRNASVQLLRFRSYFDPIYRQLREKGNNGKPMDHGAAFQQAFKSVMQMPKGSDGKYDWERVRGAAPAATVSYPDVDGKSVELRTFTAEEVRDAEAAWARQNPQLVASGMSASPGMLVPIMSSARKKIRTATTIQRDSVGGMVSWQSLAAQAATIRPGMTEQQIRDDILGKADDNSMGVFRDRGHPVRVHDLVVGYTSKSMSKGASTLQSFAYQPQYAPADANPSDVTGNAIGISLASANRYLQKLQGIQYDITSDEPASSQFMPLHIAQATMDRLLTWSNAGERIPRSPTNVSMSVLMLSPDERKAMHSEAAQALATLRSDSESGNKFRANYEYNEPQRRILRFQKLVDQLATDHQTQWESFDPTDSVRPTESQIPQQDAPEVPEARRPDVTALSPILSVQARKLLPSERVLLDQVRAVDRIEKAVSELELDIPELQVGASLNKRSEERAAAITALLEGDIRPAQKFVNGNQRELAAATWLYENVMANIPRVDRSLRQAEMAPMPQPEVITPGQPAARQPTMQESLPWLQAEMRAVVEGQPGAPKLLPSERKLYARLAEAFEQRVKLETLMSPDISPQGEEALKTIRDMQGMVLQGELRQPEQFLGSYGQEHAMAVAVQALTVKAMQKLNEGATAVGRTGAAAAATRRAARLKKILGTIEQEPWNNLLLKSKKQ